MKKNPNILDQYFKTQLDNLETPFLENDWEKMSALLDKNEQNQQRKWAWWWFPATSIWLLFCIGFYWQFTNSSQNKLLISDNSFSNANNATYIGQNEKYASKMLSFAPVLHSDYQNMLFNNQNPEFSQPQFLANLSESSKENDTKLMFNTKNINASNKEHVSRNHAINNKQSGKTEKNKIKNTHPTQTSSNINGNYSALIGNKDDLVAMEPLSIKRKPLQIDKTLKWEKPKNNKELMWLLPKWQVGVVGGIGGGAGISTTTFKADRPLLMQEAGIFVRHRIHKKGSLSLLGTFFNIANMQGKTETIRPINGVGQNDTIESLHLNGILYGNLKINYEYNLQKHVFSIGGGYRVLMGGKGTEDISIIESGQNPKKLNTRNMRFKDGLSQSIGFLELGYGYKLQPSLMIGAKGQLPFNKSVNKEMWGLVGNQKQAIFQLYIQAGLWERN